MHDAQHGTPDGASPTPPVLAVAYLAAVLDARVTVSDQIPPAPCQQCGAPGSTAVARVHGDPTPHAMSPAVVDCCRSCIPTVVDRAHRDLRDGTRVGVRLEVAT